MRLPCKPHCNLRSKALNGDFIREKQGKRIKLFTF